jgi:predicted dienelactone hydrolase
LQDGLPGLQIDPARIGALGFSLGGYTVLSTAGAQASKQGFIEYCDKYAGMLDCAWLAKGGIDLHAVDQKRYEQSNHDSRLTAVVSIDPALSQAYQAQSLANITTPIQLINLGASKEIPAAIDAGNLAPMIPGSEMVHIEQATHFSFLGECTMMGGVIIATAGEGPLCSEVGSRTRAEIHTELKATIGGYLTQHLLDQ